VLVSKKYSWFVKQPAIFLNKILLQSVLTLLLLYLKHLHTIFAIV